MSLDSSVYCAPNGSSLSMSFTSPDRMTARPLPEYSDIASNMADLGKEEVPYSADDYLPSSPPSLEKKRKIVASESSSTGANRSPSDLRSSSRPSKDEEGELDGDDSDDYDDSGKRYRSGSSRDENKDRRSSHRSDSRRSSERDLDRGRYHDRDRSDRDRHHREREHSSERSHKDRDRDHDRHHHHHHHHHHHRHGHHESRGSRRDDHRHESSHSRSDRDRERSDRDRDRGRERDHDRSKERDHEKRKESSPPQAAAVMAAVAPPAPIVNEYVPNELQFLTYVRSPALLNVVIKSPEEQEEEERRLIEERRKRRQDLIAKLQQQSAAASTTAPQPPAAESDAAAMPPPPASTTTAVLSNASSPVAPVKADEADDMFGELTAAESERLEKEKARVEAEEQRRREQEEEAQEEVDRKALEKLWSATGAPLTNAPITSSGYDELQEMRQQQQEQHQEPQPAPDATDEFDMFADSPSKLGDKVVSLKQLAERREGATMIDNWDDAEGYYNFRIGEVLADRYVVFSAYGKGVFSSVVRAKDLQSGESEVAIKLIRNNDVMYKAGQKELQILSIIRDADPENKRHCVRLLHHFEYRSHLCMVLEPLAMNLREVIRKYGKDVGLNLTAVKVYAKQMFIALRHLRKCNIIHADIKPDNILVNESKTVLKLCDFGSASLVSENEITPYLVSRFYRAPEIILGCQYDFALDMWSIGCCLVELYTGRILFEKGRSNNQMLRLMMELRGKIPNKMLKKAMPMIRSQHFDDDLNFINKVVDPLTKKETAKPLHITQPTRDFSAVLNISSRYLAEKEQKEVILFKDLLDRIFTFEPQKRITPKEALAHPFITGGVIAKK